MKRDVEWKKIIFFTIIIFIYFILGPISILFPIFGEEYGWRSYLLTKLIPLGFWKANLITGITLGIAIFLIFLKTKFRF